MTADRQKANVCQLYCSSFEALRRNLGSRWRSWYTVSAFLIACIGLKKFWNTLLRVQIIQTFVHIAFVKCRCIRKKVTKLKKLCFKCYFHFSDGSRNVWKIAGLTIVRIKTFVRLLAVPCLFQVFGVKHSRSYKKQILYKSICITQWNPSLLFGCQYWDKNLIEFRQIVQHWILLKRIWLAKSLRKISASFKKFLLSHFPFKKQVDFACFVKALAVVN